ncbi:MULTISPECIES: Type 1 glutamine amidotransferase-like domain-containing protein [Peribacillus]|uniref:Type 1 glutamine amidotransferase-like domain-containing protein n=1 Tax=Peribacillus TaxID=2675229 RepID=UPI001F4D8B73|nr:MULTISPECIES: Type 1 glutamine amidotransferase-like domain-containing protein [unclassified Peribacillus]MCK1985715.1 Type 1 glutamine amidotransferase-like domain-containing protein [Peribacillus sp. Aquil_B1]MCK2009268.1 Type 1 glutamine amidotransferase-like domain-containing protein [Peribacillus sp. Aquil_B8]
MTKILLTSNGFFTDLIKQQFLQLIDGDLSNLKATIITTASHKKQKNRFAMKAKEDLLGYGFKKVDFNDIEFDKPELLEKYNVIYINGGNPFYLLYHMKKSGADLILKDIAKQNTVIVGVSAGAITLGPNIEVVNYFTPQINIVDLQDFTALGLTDIAIFPHYDREDLFPNNSGRSIEDRLKVFENINKCSVVRLKDDESLLIQ